MKKFNKKAVFAALMGALSSVSAFAAGGKTIDNVQLYKSRNEKSLKFLDVSDFDLDLPTDRKKLQNIFQQIATIEYENFDGTINKPLNSGVVTSRWRREKNLEKFRKEGRIPKAHEWRFQFGNKTPTINPGLDLDDGPARKGKIDAKAKKYQKDFLENKTSFLVHVDNLGNVDGFIKLNINEKEKVFVEILANKAIKNGTGIAGMLIQSLQKKYKYVELSPKDDNASNFYRHMGFTNNDNGNMVWVKK